MRWYCITLTASQFSIGKHMELQHEFARAWINAGLPHDAVMYGSSANSSDHSFYFTPKAVMIAQSLLENFNAVECDEPDLKNLTPLVINST